MLTALQGKEGRPALLSALCKQYLVDGNQRIAERIATTATVKEYLPGASLFIQGARSTDLHFILTGSVSIRVDGKEIATVGAGLHVWEIGLPGAFEGRTATVVALENVIAAQITGRRFTEIARLHPDLWRRIALGLVHPLQAVKNR